MVNCNGVVVSSPRSSVTQEICRYCRTVRTLPPVDLRRRRHTSAIAPTARTCDVTRPGRGLSARQLQRAHSTDEYMIARRQANATELHASNRPLYMCDFTRTTPRLAIHDATATDRKSRSYALPGAKPSLDLSEEPNELELSTVDLRKAKYKASLPAPRKHGRRVSAADPVNSALTPVSVEHLAEIDRTGKLELEHLDSPAKETRKRPEQPRSSRRAEPIDFHLSTVDLRPRPRRHTTPDAPQKLGGSNQEPIQERRGECPPFQRQKSEPIDFHLSRFGLMPRRHTTDARPETNRPEVGHRQSRSKKMETVPATREPTTPTNSKNKLCDLAYLENFRSYTV
ncbi:hypothetical protein PHYSODRAFT_519969 [Phytophthora sojae]|uniref:Uncharacterized protein n=1 Tax=Phytophthora sojae (strain P6497) TaxID=1094619 RepID=G5A1A0_PHYSP|nr:hypothetical protein PHYSODRAFT_519969 [Phytophthora sojae]EGZ10700.1 hypothetical protein PHYSODRAFT_519969 [Phytophthora sojae]|eukprot:XP_009533445.1 hypothetical protein PHYSODRAFT_519969 [Phytophthora sojae]